MEGEGETERPADADGRTVLVTGGLGFIGSHFVRHLLRSEPPTRVVNLDAGTYAANPENLRAVRDDPELAERYREVEGDVADGETVDAVFGEHAPDVVVNFAAESHVDRSIVDAAPFVRTNVDGVRVLLEAARRHGMPRFCQVSTDEVYGDVAGEPTATSEEAPFRPSSPYAASKAAAEHLCGAYRRTHGVPVVIARPSNNYGPNQHPEKLIPLALYRLLAGEEVPVYGDGRQERDWIHVEDCVRGIRAVLRHGRPGRAYNLSTGLRRTNRKLLTTLCRIVAGGTGRDADALAARLVQVEDRPGHDRRYAPDPERAERELGWQATIPFQEGLRRTVRWYREHPGWVEGAADEEFAAHVRRVYREGWDA